MINAKISYSPELWGKDKHYLLFPLINTNRRRVLLHIKFIFGFWYMKNLNN